MRWKESQLPSKQERYLNDFSNRRAAAQTAMNDKGKSQQFSSLFRTLCQEAESIILRQRFSPVYNSANQDGVTLAFKKYDELDIPLFVFEEIKFRVVQIKNQRGKSLVIDIEFPGQALRDDAPRPMILQLGSLSTKAGFKNEVNIQSNVANKKLRLQLLPDAGFDSEALATGALALSQGIASCLLK